MVRWKPVPSDPRRPPHGFSLVDLLVAVVVVEVALLAGTGLGFQALRLLGRAERTERATAVVERIADSLAAQVAVVAGRSNTEWGHVEWSSGGGSWIQILAFPPDTLAPPLVDARVWVP